MTIRHTEDQRFGTSARADAAKTGARPWLNRLLASKRGNVLPILAASILPMAAMVGGAIDMSRAYMVKSRIQHACDAGVLAGRRAMAQTTYTSEAEAQAEAFFDVNYQEGYNDTTGVSFETENPTGSSKITGSASADMPTAIMGMFGYETLNISVTCEAELNLTNTDVTFVLDVTGSMAETLTNSNGVSAVKLTSLQEAVMSFYDTMATAAAGSDARIRYSFVPYSSNVNVGELLYDTNSAWLVGGAAGESWAYQSRVTFWQDCEIFGATQPVTCPNSRPHSAFSGGTNTTSSACSTWGGSASETSTVNGVTTVSTYQRFSWNGSNSNWSGSGSRQCLRIRTRRVTPNHVRPANSSAARVAYSQGRVTYPVSDFVRSIKTANPSVFTPTETNGSTSRWRGCIEERDTVAATTFASTRNGITADGNLDAYDLNIDDAPTNTATKWRPYWPEVYYRRQDDRFSTPVIKSNTACPSKVSLLAAMTRQQVYDYVYGLTAVGRTYHDVGLIWGARLASPQGLFQSVVNEAPSNPGSVSRHMIFMTDGQLAPSWDSATMYGVERHDWRIVGTAGTDSDQDLRHRDRYLAVCQAIKSKGIRLWVIAFGTELSEDMETCASSGSSFTADDADQLNNAFENIAKNIAELRLTQ